MTATVIDARARFASRASAVYPAETPSGAVAHPCRYCRRSTVWIHTPYVDCRRRRPWPKSFYTCDGHRKWGEADCATESHPGWCW